MVKFKKEYESYFIGYPNFDYKRVYDIIPDCTETVIRNFICNLIYDNTTRNININLLKGNVKQSVFDFFTKYNNMY